MVEQVDTQDLKSCESNLVRVRFPLLVQKPRRNTGFFVFTQDFRNIESGGAFYQKFESTN